MFFTYSQKNTVLINTITDTKLLSASVYIYIYIYIYIYYTYVLFRICNNSRRLLDVNWKAGFKHIVGGLNELQKLLQQGQD